MRFINNNINNYRDNMDNKEFLEKLLKDIKTRISIACKENKNLSRGLYREGYCDGLLEIRKKIDEYLDNNKKCNLNTIGQEWRYFSGSFDNNIIPKYNEEHKGYCVGHHKDMSGSFFFRVIDEDSIDDLNGVTIDIDGLFESLGWYIPLSKDEVKLIFSVERKYQQRI